MLVIVRALISATIGTGPSGWPASAAPLSRTRAATNDAAAERCIMFEHFLGKSVTLTSCMNAELTGYSISASPHCEIVTSPSAWVILFHNGIYVLATTDESRTPRRRKKIERPIVDARRHIHQPQNRVEKVVVADLLRRVFCETGLIDTERITHRWRQPYDHRHMDLRFWCNRVRHAVKIHEVFAEALAVIGYVKHSGIDPVTRRAGKHADEPR